MSAAKHTPGPWQWTDDYTLRPCVADVQNSATHTILSPDGPFGYRGADPRSVEAEFQANRALIEAAPDLLDAAIAAFRALSALPSPRDAMTRNVALAKLHTAIAKAQPEQVPA